MARGSGVSGAQSVILREVLAGGELVGTLLSGEWHGQRRASTVPTESPPELPLPRSKCETRLKARKYHEW